MAKKFSQFPSAASISPGDSVVGLKDGANTRFSFATVFSYIQALFVPTSRKVNNKALTSDITLDASDVGAVDTADVGVADGVASLDSNGKVPGTQLDLSSKQSTITASGILKGDGAGGVSAAIAGTDYQAPLTAGTDYATPTQLDGKANPGQIGYPETGTTASRNYSAGEYICWNGVAYTANQAISSGTTLNAGTGGNLTECAGGGFNDRSTGTVGRGTMTSGTILSASLVRWSRVVVCTCQLYGLSGINRADCVPFRMPEGFRPTSDTNIQLVFNDGNNGKQWITYGTLKSDGYVSANNAVLGSFAPNVTAIQIQSAVWLI